MSSVTDRQPEVKRIPLLTLNVEPLEYSLSQEAQSYLSSLKGKCYVISVSGKPMVGKSSLLNILISLFNKDPSQEDISYQNIYPVGNRRRSTTQDVDMYCLSIREKNFIFLDIEGDGDPRRQDVGSWIYANLLQTAVGVSHVHLYNYNGLPQENLLSDFELISKVVRQNRIHDHFKTKFVFLARDHIFESENMPAEGLEEFKAPIDERLGQSCMDYSLRLLKTPPQHITIKNSSKSCIALTGFLCKDCQSHLFLSILLDIHNELNQHLDEVAPFQSGNHLRRALEHLTELNRRELPFYSDGGQISQRRLKKLKDEKIRIQSCLYAVKEYKSQNGFSEVVERVLGQNSNPENQQFLENAKWTVKELEKNTSQIEYMIQELSSFIYRYLLNDGISIVDEKEKEILWDIYIPHFYDLTKEIIVSLKIYDEMLAKVCKYLSDIEINEKSRLSEFIKKVQETPDKGFFSVFLDSKVAVRFAQREAAGKAFALMFGIGGGAFGIALTVFCVLQASYELGEAQGLNDFEKKQKIHNIKDAEEAMKINEEFMMELINGLGEKRNTFNEVCSKNESENHDLIEKISIAIDKKINGIHLSSEDRNQLLEKMNDVENNFQKFKQCLLT